MSQVYRPSSSRKSELTGKQQDQKNVDVPKDLADATQIIAKSLKADNATKLDGLFKLLLLCKGKTEPSDWEAPEDRVTRDLLAGIRLLVCDREKGVRSQALRALRYLAWNKEVIQMISDINLPLFVSRCLERENRYMWERMQALKFIRHVMSIDPSQISRIVVQSLVAVAQHPEDDFRRVCLDTLRELAVQNTAIVASCNGIKTIVDAILDPQCQDVAESLTLTLLYILDNESTRCHLRPSLDIQRLLWVFSDTDSPDNTNKNSRREAAQKALVTMMRSWTGILCLASDQYGLKSLVQLLTLPSTVKGAAWAREAIFDLLFEILDVVKSPDSVYSASNGKLSNGPNLLYNYIVMVLIAFIENGLVESLTNIGMGSDTQFTPVARSLLGEILSLAADILPVTMCQRLNVLKPVIDKAATFSPEISTTARMCASNLIIELSAAGQSQNRIGRHHHKTTHNVGINVDQLTSKTDLNSNYIRYRYLYQRRGHTSGMRSQVQPHHSHSDNGGSETSPSMKDDMLFKMLRAQETAEISEDHLNGLLKKSTVTNSKDAHHWDIDVCWDLLEGPLWHTKLLVSAFKTKFCKRLLSFLKPNKNLFCGVMWSLNNMRYGRVACQLFRILTNSEEGCEYYWFNELITEIFDMLKAQLQSNHDNKEIKNNHDHRPLARNSVKTTLSREYFALIGILSESKRGLKFFEKHHIYEFFYNLSKSNQTEVFVTRNDYIIRMVATNLDYSHVGTSRILLAHWLSQGSIYLRQYLIDHLRLLFRAKIKGFEQWGIRMLAAQLKSTYIVALSALSVLEEACDDREDPMYLHELIHVNPDFSLVRREANRILILFLGVPEGVKYLQTVGWITPQLNYWSQGGNTRYVESLESCLVNALNDGPLGASTEGEANGDGKEEEPPKEVEQPEPIPSFSARSPLQEPDELGNVENMFKPTQDRSEEDDYYYDRLQNLPWTVTVTVSYPSGREIEVLTDTFLVYDYRPIVANVPVINDPNSYGPPVGCAVLAVMLDNDGSKKVRHIDPRAEIHAKLDIGSSCLESVISAKRREQTCTADERGKLTSAHNVIITQSCVWEFELIMTRTLENKLQETNESVRTYLSSIAFKIPIPQNSNSVVRPLPHLYGQLAKTDDGIQILKKSGYLAGLINSVATQQQENEKGEKDEKFEKDEKDGTDELFEVSNERSLRKRADLWAIAVIGSSESGFKLLEESNAIEHISHTALNCPRLSMRGTCFYILGLLSCTSSARQMLSKLGWDFPLDSSLGIAVPVDMEKFLEVPSSPYVGSWATSVTNKFGVSSVQQQHTKKAKGKLDLKNDTDRWRVILSHISGLSNNVTQKASYAALVKLRSNHKNIFESTTLLLEAMKLLSAYTFRLPARRFVLYDLFDPVEFTTDSIRVFDDPIVASADRLVADQLYSKRSRAKKLTPRPPSTPKPNRITSPTVTSPSYQNHTKPPHKERRQKGENNGFVEDSGTPTEDEEKVPADADLSGDNGVYEQPDDVEMEGHQRNPIAAIAQEQTANLTEEEKYLEIVGSKPDQDGNWTNSLLFGAPVQQQADDIDDAG